MSTNVLPGIELRPLEPRDAVECDRIVASLPYHFGQEAGRRECAEAVRRSEGIVAVEDGAVVGFLTLERHFYLSAEITWMAVHADHRRHGIGHALVARLCDKLRGEGRSLLLVLTVSPADDTESDPADGYRATRTFYESVGFVLARDLAGLWEGDIPVLMVRTL